METESCKKERSNKVTIIIGGQRDKEIYVSKYTFMPFVA